MITKKPKKVMSTMGGGSFNLMSIILVAIIFLLLHIVYK
jgi:hypothetical protein